MPQNTYKDDLGPAAGVYKYVYCIAALSPLTDTQAPYVIFFFLLSLLGVSSISRCPWRAATPSTWPSSRSSSMPAESAWAASSAHHAPKPQAPRWPRAPCAVHGELHASTQAACRQPHAPLHRPLGACCFCSPVCSVLAAACGKQGRSQRAAAARGPDGMWSSQHKRHGARSLGAPSWCGARGPVNGELMLLQRAADCSYCSWIGGWRARVSQLACCFCCSPACYCSATC